MKIRVGGGLTSVNVATLLSHCGRRADLRLGSSLHAAVLKSSHLPDDNTTTTSPSHDDQLLLHNSLISMYTKCGRLADAQLLFQRMQHKDTVSWNAIIWGCLSAQDFHSGFRLLNRMRAEEVHGTGLDKATITTVLSSLTDPTLLYAVNMLHSVVVSCGFGVEVPVGNALVTGYFKCGCSQSARRVFDEMPVTNVVTWTAVVSGLAQSSEFEDSLLMFADLRRWVDANPLTYSSSLQACSGLQALEEGRQIHGIVLKVGVHADVCVESALMDMYSKCGSMDDAYRIFELAEEYDDVTLTVLLTGFAQNGMEGEALDLFMKMMRVGVRIDANMVSAVLGVFGVITSLALGKQIHSLVIKKRFGINPFVGNGLINMYSRCGEFGESIKIFNKMPDKNVVSWNSVVAGFARHGFGFEAFQAYETMLAEGFKPTDITFLSLLHACSHVGSIGKGMQLLESMARDHKISPRMEHHACVVDLLGRAGHLEQAKCYIDGLPGEPSALLWQALLGACRIHGNLEMGRYAASCLLRLQPDCSAAYVLMADMYSRKERWERRASLIREMKEMGMKKETGFSWIEMEKDVHCFVVRDKVHPQNDTIYEVLDGLIEIMRDEDFTRPGFCGLTMSLQ